MEDITITFKKAGSFGIADAIMSLLTRSRFDTEIEACDEYSKKYGLEIYADAWDNCREQGYKLNGDIMGRRFSICFGEHRNVDTPTIWHSEGCRWPDEGKWKNENVETLNEAVDKIIELTAYYVNKYSSEHIKKEQENLK